VVNIANKGGGNIVPPFVKNALQTVFAILYFILFLYQPSNIYTMKVHVAWEHSGFKKVDLVAIQSSDPQVGIFNWPILRKV
jgi:hypothetical protein